MKNKISLSFLLFFLAVSMYGYAQVSINIQGKSEKESRYTIKKISKNKYSIEKDSIQKIKEDFLINDSISISNLTLGKEIFNVVYDSNKIKKIIEDSISKKSHLFTIVVKAKRQSFELEEQTIYLESSLEVDKIVYIDSIEDEVLTNGKYRYPIDNKVIEIQNGRIKKITEIPPPPRPFDYKFLISFFTNIVLFVIIILLFIKEIKKIFSKKQSNTNEKTVINNLNETSEKNIEEIKSNPNDDLILRIKNMFEIDENRPHKIIKSIEDKISDIKNKAKANTKNDLINEIKNLYNLGAQQDNDIKKIIKTIISDSEQKANQDFQNKVTKLNSEISEKSDIVNQTTAENKNLTVSLNNANNTIQSLKSKAIELENETLSKNKIAENINKLFTEFLKELNNATSDDDKSKLALSYLLKIALHNISFSRVIENRDTKDDELNLKLLLEEKISSISKISIDSAPNESDALTRSIIILLKQNNIRTLDGVFVRGKKISD
jgi:hypothetical protein